MQPGDLIVDRDGQLGVILTEPRLSEDCMPGYPVPPSEEYYLIDVQFPKWIESVATDEVELISYVQR